MGVGNKI